MWEAGPLKFFVPDYGDLSGLSLYQRHLITAQKIVEGGIGKIQPGRTATTEDLLLFHKIEYIDALKTGQPSTLASSGAEWFDGTYDLALSKTGAFLDALDEAKIRGVSAIMGGGGHHASPGRGGALGITNELGIGVHYVRKKFGVKKVFMLDLDMHFCNGTAAGFPNDPELYIFDYHGSASNLFQPRTPHLIKNLADTPQGDEYLRQLKLDLPQKLDKFQPEFCIYLAGMDVFIGSAGARLFLNENHIRLREEFVFQQLAQREIPVAYGHGGGYLQEEPAAQLHLISARAAYQACHSGPPQ